MFSRSTGQAVSHQPQVVQAQKVSGGTTVSRAGSAATAASRCEASFMRATAVSSGASASRWWRTARFTSLCERGLPVT